MAAARKSNEKAAEEEKNICRNRRAAHEYELVDKLECGISLQGTEVKSLRDGGASLEDAYARVQDGEVWMIGCDIPEYRMGNIMNHKPKRPRKLLLHRREIGKFVGKASEKGFTLVPVRMYFKHGLVKVELAVARGKQLHDKRESLKTADAKRDIQRAMRQRRK